MESKIKKMHIMDLALVFFFIFFMWGILGSVIVNTSKIVSNSGYKILIISVGVTIGILATNSLIVVIKHLKKNRNQLYTEDILCSIENSKNS